MISHLLSGGLDCSVSFLLLVLPRDSSAPRRNAVGSLVLVERGEREGNWSAAAEDGRTDGGSEEATEGRQS